MYGSVVWSSYSKENLDRILKLRKRAARIILSAEKTTCSTTLFNGLNWISFTDEPFIRSAIVYKRVDVLYIIAPNISTLSWWGIPMFIAERHVFAWQIYIMPSIYNRITEGGRTFAVRTTKDWNSIDINIRKADSLNNFKKKLHVQNILSAQKISSLWDVFLRF